MVLRRTCYSASGEAWYARTACGEGSTPDNATTSIPDIASTGCGGGNYCPRGLVNRSAMAVFLLRARHWSGFIPPAATGTVFGDVTTSTFLAKWIEQLALEGITGGCGGGNYCPGATVTRGEMAKLIRLAFGL